MLCPLRKLRGIFSHFRFSKNRIVKSRREVTSRLRTQTVKNKPKEQPNLCSGGLRGDALNGSLNFGGIIHDHGIQNGADPVSGFAKCGSSGSARKVYDKMPDRDVMLCTALISGVVAEGKSGYGISLYSKMRNDGIRPNGYLLVTVLKACSLSFELNFGTQLHAEVIKLGVLFDVFVGSALTNLYAKCGDMQLANKVFNYMPEKNVVSWNSLLNGYANVGDAEEVLKLFCKMREPELRNSKFTLSTVLKSCSDSKNIIGGKIIHSVAIKIGIEVHDILVCCLVAMYTNCTVVKDAVEVFKYVRNPSTLVWSSIINCLHVHGHSREATKMFSRMMSNGTRPNQYTLACIVNAASTLGDQLYCEGIHACIYKSGFESDTFLSNSLITMYMKIGFPHKGWQIFNAIDFPDLASWNALLTGLSENEIYHYIPVTFIQMLREGFKPDMYTFTSVLKSCSALKNLIIGIELHAYLIKNGFHLENSVATSLIEMYATSNLLKDVEVVSDELLEKDLSAWTVIITAYAKNDHGEKAIECFCKMRNNGLKPNEFSLSSSIGACAVLKRLDIGRQIHALSFRSGFICNLYVASSLIEMYIKCELIEEAEFVFKRMALCNIVLWNSIICGYSRSGQGKKAYEAFQLMADEGVVVPDDITFLGVLSGCSQTGLIKEGKQVFNSMFQIYKITPTLEHCAFMVDMLCQEDEFDKVKTFIHESNLTQNPLILETILRVGEKATNSVGRQIHSYTIKKGFHGYNSLGTSLIDMYVKTSCLKDAEVISNDLLEKDFSTWMAIIAVFSRADHCEKAVNCFNQMRNEGVEPNEFTISSVLSCCCSLKALKSGIQLHGLSIKSGLVKHSYIATSLVHMYAKCRSIKESEAVFTNMVSRNRVSWNTIICGYSRHGQGDKAIKAFQKMLHENIVPDEITLFGVLSACSHMGFIREGKTIFNSLAEVYKITPTIEHCACMVTILCQEGDFDAVEEFIRDTNLGQETLIWETLLSFCKTNSNVNFIEKTAKKLCQLEPELDYNYVSLSSIYASIGKWDDVAKIRALMSDRGLRKQPGCSWIEVDDRANVFFAQDDSNLYIRDISLQLEKLARWNADDK